MKDLKFQIRVSLIVDYRATIRVHFSHEVWKKFQYFSNKNYSYF